MKSYKATYQGQTLHILAQDMDHVITITSRLANRLDYTQFCLELDVVPISHKNYPDKSQFYKGLSK